MAGKNTVGLALIKELCPVCAKEMDGPIIILTKKNAEEVESLHGQVLGYSNKLCTDCQKVLDEKGEDFVYLIMVDETKTEDKRNPYRTGKVYMYDKNNLNNPEQFKNKTWLFCAE